MPETCFVAGGRQAIPLETLGEGLHRNKETTVTDSRTVPSNLAGFPAHRPAVIVILYFLLYNNSKLIYKILNLIIKRIKNDTCSKSNF